MPVPFVKKIQQANHGLSPGLVLALYRFWQLLNCEPSQNHATLFPSEYLEVEHEAASLHLKKRSRLPNQIAPYLTQ